MWCAWSFMGGVIVGRRCGTWGMLEPSEHYDDGKIEEMSGLLIKEKQDAWEM